jgi:hypothetical protein
MTNRKNEFSFLNGYSFVFESDGHLIEAWCSTLTGAEKIFVDGTLVSEKRSIKKNSHSDFFVDGYSSVFSIDLNVMSLLTGPCICTLLKDGEPIQRQRLVFPRLSPYRFAMLFVLGGIVGAFLSIADKLLGWPFWLVILLATVVTIALISQVTKKPVIEEDPI